MLLLTQTSFSYVYSHWIYDNIMEKWDNIKRKPAKLVDMFTGYHATRAVIHAALHNAGIDGK